MNPLYCFLFCLGLGVAARGLYMGMTALARRTNLFPVTLVLDMATALITGGALTAFIIFTSAVIAPYMFAALLSGYFISYKLTAKKRTG